VRDYDILAPIWKVGEFSPLRPHRGSAARAAEPQGGELHTAGGRGRSASHKSQSLRSRGTTLTFLCSTDWKWTHVEYKMTAYCKGTVERDFLTGVFSWIYSTYISNFSMVPRCRLQRGSKGRTFNGC
jgi:hypothetical protein